MTEPDTTSTELALRRLSDRYAIAADRRDGDDYAGVFAQDGCLRVHRGSDPDEEVTELRGHEELARVPAMLMKSYDRTFHFVGQSVFEIREEEATGVVYCQAHHLVLSRHGGTSYLMFLRYEDRYGWVDRRDWRIASRDVWVEWTETTAANALGT
jgi:hypothetical protein